MAATAWATALPTEEVFFKNESVSLCLLLNRKTRLMRIIDYRAGSTPSKRTFVLSVARRENIERIYTLVERDEVGTWVRAGLVREGNIPGFYRRSDAFILGATISPRATQARSKSRSSDPASSKSSSDKHLNRMPLVSVARVDVAEHTVQAARRLARTDREDNPAAPALRLIEPDEQQVRKLLTVASRQGRALTSFEPFGRDTSRSHYLAANRGRQALLMSVELQPCFGNALIEVLTSPEEHRERLFYGAALESLCARLATENVHALFALSPADDVPLASVFVAAGFRRTGVLAGHMILSDGRHDAVLWTRKGSAL